MKKDVLSMAGGLFVGALSAYLTLFLLAPMGGSQMKISYLPVLIGTSLLGGLVAQRLILSRFK